MTNTFGMLNNSVIVFFSWFVSAYAVLLATARASTPNFAQIQFDQADQNISAKLSKFLKKIENYTSWDTEKHVSYTRVTQLL